MDPRTKTVSRILESAKDVLEEQGVGNLQPLQTIIERVAVVRNESELQRLYDDARRFISKTGTMSLAELERYEEAYGSVAAFVASIEDDEVDFDPSRDDDGLEVGEDPCQDDEGADSGCGEDEGADTFHLSCDEDEGCAFVPRATNPICVEIRTSSSQIAT